MRVAQQQVGDVAWLNATLVQTLTFPEALVSIIAEDGSGKIVVASARDVFVLQPLTEGWTKIWWEKTLWLRREDAGDVVREICSRC